MPSYAQGQNPAAKRLRTALTLLAWFNLLSCMAGAWGVAAQGPKLFGTDLLAGTPFEGRYWVGALLLGGVVGGAQLLAAVAALTASARQLFFHLLAGVTMVCWIYGEVTVIGGGSWLQHLYFAVGLLQIGLVAISLGVTTGFGGRDRHDGTVS